MQILPWVNDMKTIKQVFLFLPLALLLFLSTTIVSPSSSHALELDQAKAQGSVGELANGYLGVVISNPPADVLELVTRINNARRLKYTEIAKNRTTTVAAVEALAGQTAIEKTAPGHYIKVNGTWQKK
jgi:uncharacterized protein YdbL (DUF1318 family)